MKNLVRIVTLPKGQSEALVESFLQRPATDEKAEAVARDVISQIRTGGEKALLDCISRYDRVTLRGEDLLVSAEELDAAREAVPVEFKAATVRAHENVTRFSSAGMRRDWSIATAGGGKIGEQFAPFERVGVYVPGGTAPLASTVVMTVTLARVAGVPEIVVCTPAGKDGKINPHLLYAAELSGATEIYKVGGAQAIAAMAYGTERIRKVQKIVGPGGLYVTAAKKLVYGAVALDMIAGPSEVAILADASANPAFVAADMLAQAEHGTGAEKALLVTNDRSLAEKVQQELVAQTEKLSRRALIEPVLAKGTLIVVVDDLVQGLELCNMFAPEHFELLVAEPQKLVRGVRAAGAVFLGPWTPESVGDFVAGPSHVLPTGGAARLFSGLTVDDFRRRTSVVSYTRDDLEAALPVIEAFGKIEGLDGHSYSAKIRFGDRNT